MYFIILIQDKFDKEAICFKIYISK